MKIKEISAEIANLTAGEEISLFHVEKQVEFDGIEMGVLESGLPYLSETGLARMCGITRKTLYQLATSWREEKLKPRGRAINEKLIAAGYTDSKLFIQIDNDGQLTNAYTEPVCMALLEYYAFDASEPKPEALRAARRLLRESFRTFVYRAVGYSPETTVLDSWRHWFDRVDCIENAVPTGYFCVFSEIAPIIVPMIKSGLIITDKVIPDISVGKLWSKFWEDRGLDEAIGKRTRYLHNYPPYYRQALSNPQRVYAYPEEALGLFRAWLRNYVEQKFPKYLLDQAKKGMIGKQDAAKAIESFKDKNRALPKQ